MSIKDNRVDSYIENAAVFARPILKHLRTIIHEASPEITETIKWGFPHFEYKGVICSMSAFKSHCAFGFWKEDLIPGMTDYIKEKEAMGSWGRIETIDDLPPDEDIIKFIHAAINLNIKGIKVAKKINNVKRDLEIPDYFMKAVRSNKKALATFENFSYTNKKEYVEWVDGAKTEETKGSRLKTAVEWMSAGKIKNWKYMKK